MTLVLGSFPPCPLDLQLDPSRADVQYVNRWSRAVEGAYLKIHLEDDYF